MQDDRADSALNSFDFSAIEEMDPSLGEGHHVTYDREVPFELRIQDAGSGPQEVGTLEAIKTKLLILGEDSNPRHIKIELTSENDLFFHYIHSIDEAGFRKMQETQKLMIEFAELPTIMVRMLNACIKEPHSFLAVFIMHRDGRARLDFIQNIEYKFIELLSLDFVASSEENVRQQITYRYNSVKSKLAILQARLQDISALVKVKNPSLLLQLQRNPKKSVRN
jgi:cold shock CspA family protein